MPPRPLIAAFAALTVAACTGDDAAPADGTEADSTSGDVLTTGTLSGGMTTGDDDDDNDIDGSSTTGGDDDDDDDSSSDDGPVACRDNTDCEGMGNQVFCEGGVCVDCSAAPDGDAACASLDADRPVCEANSGACVACTSTNDSLCQDTTPICDAATYSCRECLQHSECGSGACKIPLNMGTNDPNWGACFENVVTVAVSDVQAAFDDFDGTELAIIIDDDEAGGSTTLNIEIDGNIDIALIGADGELPNFRQGVDEPRISLSGNAAAWLSNVRVSGVGAFNSFGIAADGAQVHIQRSRIVRNDGGGISLANNGRAVIENSFVSGNFDVAPALSVSSSSASVLYSTLGRPGNFVGDPVVACSSPDQLTVRNSIVVNQTDTVGNEVCMAATVTNSVVETTTTPTMWMAGFAADDYVLTGHPAGWETTAVWLDGDPPTDINGTLRPTVDGTEDVAGAHIP